VDFNSRFFALFFTGFAFFSYFLTGCVYLKHDARDFDFHEYKAQYKEDAVRELEDVLSGVNFDGRSYERGFFDCSNMSAYLFDYLQTKGYECAIVVGVRKFFDIFKVFSDEGGHSWIIVEKNGCVFFVESTRLGVISPDNLIFYSEYIFRFYFKSLRFLKFITTLVGNPREWEY
jgi:hypothetical protein